MKIPFSTLLILFLFLQSCDTSVSKETETSATPPSEEVTPAINSPDIPIYDFAGLESIFNQKNDTTYVINFWATWCKPCVQELPYFVELHEKYQSEKFKLIFVSMDFPKQIVKKLIPFLQKNQLPGTMMVLDDPDANSWIPKVSDQWSGAIPATVIYRQEQREFYEKSFHDFDELDQVIQPFFK